MFFNTENLMDQEVYLKLIKTSDANLERGWLPAYYFKICLIQTNEEIGDCDLRIGHNTNTYYGGNIGYGIKEAFRGKHYAAKACQILFSLARRHEVTFLYITCSPENLASRRTCELAGGELIEIVELPPDNDMYMEGERSKCVYKFDLC